MVDVEFDFSPNTNEGRISISDPYWKAKLYDEFSAPNTQKRFIGEDKRHWIKDNIYFITPTGRFHFGIGEMIGEWLRKHISPESLNIKFSQSFLDRFKKDKDDTVENNLKFELREYQQESVRLALRHGFGTFVLGTGAGKTFTIACIIDNLIRRKGVKKVLILVPDNNLVIQFNDELSNQYGLQGNISLFYNKFNKIDPEANIIIANRPLFLSRFKENKKFFVDEVDCLIVDEAHSIKNSNKVTDCVKKMKAKYRFGFTGTLAEDKADYFKTLGLLGKVRYEKTSKSLRDEGFLSSVKVRLITLKHPKVINYRMEEGRRIYFRYPDEVEYLQRHEARNAFLGNLVFGLKKNTLLLVNRLEHGFLLEEVFNNINVDKSKKIYFVRGDIEASVRDDIRRLMEDEDDVICVAITKIFSTGINIKNLHNVVFAAGGKSAITVVQAIGRGLRLHPNKKQLNIFDVADFGYKYSMRHREKRIAIFEKEKIPTKAYEIHLVEIS